MEKNGDGFIDRSKVRILLCDNDDSSSQEVFTLLCKCSYQVTSVKSPRQVIDALNAEGPDIDIILSEVDLPMSKGLKMLKYIMRDKEWRRIPVIMMSAQDEVAVVVKCLKFGAADYLVKPLRTNELLNLWTHMWRRRRMLGLEEKNLVSYDFDLAVSDPSGANTNSTTLFSDDTDDKSRKSTNSETCVSTRQETQMNATAAPIETVPRLNNDIQRGQMSPFPKNKELKIGESSAFLSYVKSNFDTPKITRHVEKNLSMENHSQADEISQKQMNHTNGEFSRAPHLHLTNNFYPNDLSGYYNHTTYPYYIPNHATTPAIIPHQYNHIPYYPPPFHNNNNNNNNNPYYPFGGICLQPGQAPTTSFEKSSNEGKDDRRLAALMKFRQKRKERCFDKKIRYVNRKKLAERRPRNRGQFVRKVNGVNVDLNGEPASAEDDDEEDEDYEEEDPSSMDDASVLLRK
ncbi:PREDICTED: two-component response regulator-like APRR1 isoform X2 [Erythranthe guttata]|uniref:two-component response regulator-like APRR1 isoform X2 n=1 Tax=Erythranthe guttata TaxID=4155 RepID=UPI00064DADD0|nr:PREDICTED: two-component response regulator-like APRR1 isoform X2 [Erythranthe guttata]|eukprot:XP_012839343.1 PREDICTED: two-component response regulator-like APRR1 isoform X2 [Erythranthe guttata]